MHTHTQTTAPTGAPTAARATGAPSPGACDREGQDRPRNGVAAGAALSLSHTPAGGTR
jgi:hypothetical protein